MNENCLMYFNLKGLRMQSTPPKVSIVIPVYNIGEVIIRTLESIQAQTEQSFEVICVNDGSTDNGKTLAVLEACAAKDSRIRVVTQPNTGPAAARSNGLSLARGKFFYACDQDDVLHPQLLEYSLWALEHYHAEFIAFRHQTFYGESPSPQPLPKDFETIPIIVADDSVRQNTPKQYVQAHEIHTDNWIQFSTTALARTYPFLADASLPRPFALLQKAERWVVSQAVLYFYNGGQENSMMHNTISLKKIACQHTEVRLLFDLYTEEREKNDPIGLWAHQRKWYIIKFLKITFNMIRRGKSLSREERDLRLRAFTDILYEFFIEKKISFRDVSFRHKIAYLWLLFRFKFLKRT